MHRPLSIGAEYRIIEALPHQDYLMGQRIKILAQLPDADLKRPFVRAEVLVTSGSYSGRRITIGARLERVHKKETCNCIGKLYPHRRGDRDCNYREDALCYCGECGKSCSVHEERSPQPGQPNRLELQSRCHNAQCYTDPELTMIYDPWRTP